MLLVASDENIPGRLIRGLLRRNPAIDLIRVQDVGLRSAPDDLILEWCARENRILISHDRNTIVAAAYSRVEQGLSMPGVFLIDDFSGLGEVIASLLVLIEDSMHTEWKDTVQFIPL